MPITHTAAGSGGLPQGNFVNKFVNKFPTEGRLPVYLCNFETGSEFTPLAWVSTFFQEEGGNVKESQRGMFFGFVPDSTIVPVEYAHLKNKVSIFVVNKTLMLKIIEQYVISTNGDDLTEPFALTLEPSTPSTKTVHLMVITISKNKSGFLVPEFSEAKPSPRYNTQYIEAFKQSLVTSPIPYATLQDAEWGFNAMTNGYLTKQGLTQYLQPVKPIENADMTQAFDPFKDASEEDTF